MKARKKTSSPGGFAAAPIFTAEKTECTKCKEKDERIDSLKQRLSKAIEHEKLVATIEHLNWQLEQQKNLVAALHAKIKKLSPKKNENRVIHLYDGPGESKKPSYSTPKCDRSGKYSEQSPWQENAVRCLEDC